MGRAILASALFTAACGSGAKSYTVQADFLAGGDAPAAASFDNRSLTAPFADDVADIASIGLRSATLESLDGQDLSFIGSFALQATKDGNASSFEVGSVATPAAGARSVRLDLGKGLDLTDHLKAGGALAALVTPTAPFPGTRMLRLTLVVSGLVVSIGDPFSWGGLDPGDGSDPGDEPGSPEGGDCGCDLRAPQTRRAPSAIPRARSPQLYSR